MSAEARVSLSLLEGAATRGVPLRLSAHPSPCQGRRMNDAYRWARRFVRTLVRFFFRRIEVTGKDAVPATGGGIVVSWHPNGLIDPALLMAYCPRRIVFGARHGLFAWPLFGAFLRALGTVPIYRASDVEGGDDEEARRARNRQSLDALAAAVAGGGYAALFPEGVSHDAPHLLGLKTGAARLYYRACALAPAGTPPPAIVPVGLHYDDKAVMRSGALVRFHPPIALPPSLAAPPPEAPDDPEAERARVQALTDLVEEHLRNAVHPTESWKLHHLMHRVRKLFRAERAHRAGLELAPSTLAERQLGFARVWAGYEAIAARDPERTRALLERVAVYDADLVALGLDDAELDHPPDFLSLQMLLILALQVLMVFFFLPPILVAGYVINLPTHFLLKGLASRASKLAKDVATVKLGLGLLLYPLTWALWAFATARGFLHLGERYPALPDTPWAFGLTVFALGALGGAVALRYVRLLEETVRAWKVRRTRRQGWVTVGRLLGERQALFDALGAMVEDVELPGRVTSAGLVVE